MTAYKKVTRGFREYVLTLDFPEESIIAVKHGAYRVGVADVLSAEAVDGSPACGQFCSLYDWNFIY